VRAIAHSELTSSCISVNAPGTSTQSTGVSGGGRGEGLCEGACGVTADGLGADGPDTHKSWHVVELAHTVLQLAAQRPAIGSSRAYPGGMDQVLIAPPTNMDVIALSKAPNVPAHSWAVSIVEPNALAVSCKDPSARTLH